MACRELQDYVKGLPAEPKLGSDARARVQLRLDPWLSGSQVLPQEPPQDMVRAIKIAETLSLRNGQTGEPTEPTLGEVLEQAERLQGMFSGPAAREACSELVEKLRAFYTQQREEVASFRRQKAVQALCAPFGLGEGFLDRPIPRRPRDVFAACVATAGACRHYLDPLEADGLALEELAAESSRLEAEALDIESGLGKLRDALSPLLGVK